MFYDLGSSSVNAPLYAFVEDLNMLDEVTHA